MFRQGFTCPALLVFTAFYGRPFQTVFLEPYQLKGCSPFARRYSGNLG